ncbi:hypothetical protein [Streptomyces carpaticus]|uniref:hypothetical protein n=1 Tax=Streptomyces carpaticus TaxID=285558 RepID=UPI0031F8DC88
MKETGEQTKPKTSSTTPATPATTHPARAPLSLHHLQRTAGNAAVSRLVAQRYTPPVKPPPAQAPGMRRVNADIGAKKQKLAAHPAPTAESRAAQDAAVAPPDDRQAQAKTQQAEKMNAAEPGDFDKAAFIAAVNQAVEAQAPKNLDEADKFSDSGNADRIKDEVDGKVADGKDTSSEEIATATGETPDTSNTTEKDVTPLTADQPPGNPGAPNAGDAVPDRQPEEVTDFSEGQRDTEQRMAEADVTEEQLARGNEPDFDHALAEKKQGEEETAAAPAQARAAENTELQTAKSGAAAAGAQAMAGLTATREATGRQVDSGKTETKSADEQKREQVTATLQKVFDRTKTDVEKILDSLDGKVDTQFTNGEKRARDAFTADHERRMKAYKDKRYSGLRGKARWVKDKFAGLPEEANGIYQESRKLYVNQMQGVISDIADTIGRELGRAKTRIGQGRAELQAEVEKLPADLRRFGEEAAQDFAGQFDDLETQVDEKSEQLVQDLAQKYTEALDAIDEEITALQEANKGLWDRVKDAVVGVIQTIIELTNALMGILAKAASAVSKIIKDPIGFLGNVVRYVGDGLNLFTANIEQHLKTGLVSWLLGTAVKTGLQIPAKFDAKGIVQLLASLLGLTWDTIRAKIVRKGVPDKAMATVEKSIPEAQALQREGPAGLTKEITGESGDLKKTILDDLKSYLIPTVIVAGIAWIVSLLTPASAFVRAVKGIIDIVTFIVTQAAQITDFMNAILDAVIAIADGAASGVPKLIESALSTSIPLLLGFLAALLGIGSLATKVRSVFQKVSRPVGRAIDKIITRIARAGKKILRSRKGKDGRRTRDEAPGNRDDSRAPSTPVKLPTAPFQLDGGERHTVAFEGNSRTAPLVVRSTPQPIDDYLENWRKNIENMGDESERKNQSAAHDKAKKKREEVVGLQKGIPLRRQRSVAPGTQGKFERLIRSLADLARLLSEQKRSGPPLPPPVLPAFRNQVLAVPFTAEYLADPLPKGQESSGNDGSTLEGWDYVDLRDLQGPEEYWLKMHLLPARLGGKATDSNLVPARQRTNNPEFLAAVEEPAYSYVMNGNPKNPMIWYSVAVDFNHAGFDGFPSSISVEWGTYDSSGDQWVKRGQPLGRHSAPQAPPPTSPVMAIDLNAAGESRIAKRMGGNEYLYFARQVTRLRVVDGKEDPYDSVIDMEERLTEWYEGNGAKWGEFPRMLQVLKDAISNGDIYI